MGGEGKGKGKGKSKGKGGGGGGGGGKGKAPPRPPKPEEDDEGKEPDEFRSWQLEICEDYKESLEAFFAANGVVKPADLDRKALQLLAILHGKDRSSEALKYLEQALNGIPRENIQNWRAYVYTLLRSFDDDAYETLKSNAGQRNRPPRGSDRAKDKEVAKAAKSAAKTESLMGGKLRAEAVEFVPGMPWPPPGDAIKAN